jgi:hypothetical protein
VTRSSTLLEEIERDLLNGKPIADLLRKCLLLAGRSHAKDLRAWARQELRGYDNVDEVPSYRRVPAVIQADGIAGNNLFRGHTIGVSDLPEFVREGGLDNTVVFTQGIGELEALTNQRSEDGDNTIRIALPGHEIIAKVFDHRKDFQHTDRIYWSLTPAAVLGTIDHVRTTLTEFVAELAATVPRGQAGPSSEQTDKAFQVAITGKRSRVTVVNARASNGAHAAAGVRPTPTDSETDQGWWTFSRRLWAGIVSLATVAGGVAAVVVLFQ